MFLDAVLLEFGQPKSGITLNMQEKRIVSAMATDIAQGARFASVAIYGEPIDGICAHWQERLQSALQAATDVPPTVYIGPRQDCIPLILLRSGPK